MFAFMLRIIFLLILINLSFIFMHSFGIHILIDYPSGWWQLKTVVQTCNVYLVGLDVKRAEFPTLWNIFFIFLM